MKIVIAGASGFIGKALSCALSKNHQLIFLTHDKKKEGKGFFYWNPEEGHLDASLFEGVEAVINLAGENISSGRWTSEKKKRLVDSRIKSTSLLVNTLSSMQAPPSLFINASAIGYYGDRGEEILTEKSPTQKGFLPSLCHDWEEASSSLEKAGIRRVVIRIGVVLSPEGGMLKKVLPPFKWGLGGVIGSGKQYMSWIALQDLVDIFLFMLTHTECHGIYNAVSPEPVTNQEFTKALGATLHRPTYFPLPAFMARLLFGEMADALLLSSARVYPERLLESGYRFKISSLKEALKS